MFAVAFFFQASGEALDKDVDPKCIPDDMWEALGRTIAVGLVSSVLSTTPPALLGLLHTRDFQVYREEDSPERLSQLRYWRCMDVLLLVLTALSIIWSIFFSCLFLANV